MEEAQNIMILKSTLALQLQLAEEEKKKIVEDYKLKSYDSFKENLLAINNKINSLNEEMKQLGVVKE